MLDFGAPRIKERRLSAGAIRGLGSYSAEKFINYPVSILWMLAEDTDSWVRNRGLWYSWHSKLSEYHVGMGPPSPPSPTGAAERGQVDVKQAVGVHQA